MKSFFKALQKCEINQRWSETSNPWNYSISPLCPTKRKEMLQQRRFLLITKQGLSSQIRVETDDTNTTWGSGEFPSSFSVSQLERSSIWNRTNLGCRTRVLKVPKASSIPALPSLWQQQISWTQFLTERHHWCFAWRFNLHLFGLIHIASVFWLVYLALKK